MNKEKIANTIKWIDIIFRIIVTVFLIFVLGFCSGMCVANDFIVKNFKLESKVEIEE